MIASRGDVWLSTRWIRIVGVGVSAALVALVASGSLSSAAPSETEALRIEATAPDSCPARTLGDRVRSHTSRVREAKAGERARALHVVITSEADGFVAQLRLVEEGEALERRVPGKTCEEVLAAVALITALAIDPLASAVPTDAGASRESEEIEDAAPDARAPVVTEVDAGRPPPPRAPVHARFGVSLEAYGLGQVVLGRAVWIEGGLSTRAAPALRLKVARTQSFTEESEARPAFFQLTTIAVEGCVTALRTRAELDPGTIELRPCAQIASGVLEGSSSAFGSVHDMPRPWASLGAMVQARWRFFGPLELEAAFGLTVPLVRDNFFFLPRSDVYRAPGVLLLGNVGVGTTFR